jgi:hypothetical protein
MSDERVMVNLTPEEKRQFRSRAGKNDVSMAKLGGSVISQWLAEQTDDAPDATQQETDQNQADD